MIYRREDLHPYNRALNRMFMEANGTGNWDKPKTYVSALIETGNWNKLKKQDLAFFLRAIYELL